MLYFGHRKFSVIPSLLLLIAIASYAETDLPKQTNKQSVKPKVEVPIPKPYTREQRLLNAARKGDLHTILRAVELGVDINTKDGLGRTPLLLAVRHTSSVDLVSRLHSLGGKIDKADNNGRTPLSYAVTKGDKAILDYLVTKGVEIDQGDKQGRTPLYYAASSNQVEVARLLINKGSAVNKPDKFGDTPLMMACAKGYTTMVSLLLKNGADPTLQDQEGRTAYTREVHAPGCRELLPKQKISKKQIPVKQGKKP